MNRKVSEITYILKATLHLSLYFMMSQSLAMIMSRPVNDALSLYLGRPNPYSNSGDPAGKLLRSRLSRFGFRVASGEGSFTLLLGGRTTSFSKTCPSRGSSSRVPVPRLEKSFHSKDGRHEALAAWAHFAAGPSGLKRLRVLRQYLCVASIRWSRAKNSSKLSPSPPVQGRFGMGSRKSSSGSSLFVIHGSDGSRGRFIALSLESSSSGGCESRSQNL